MNTDVTLTNALPEGGHVVLHSLTRCKGNIETGIIGIPCARKGVDVCVCVRLF